MNKDHIKHRIFFRNLSTLLLTVARLTILYLTLQPQKQTISLSPPFYEWFRAHGFRGTEHELRSWAHVPEYFLFGCMLAFFGLERGYPPVGIFLFGGLFGLAYETLKIFLLSREFDLWDCAKDLLGLIPSLLLFLFLYRSRNPNRTGKKRAAKAEEFLSFFIFPKR